MAQLTKRGLIAAVVCSDSFMKLGTAQATVFGVPHRVVLSDRGLKNGEVEYQGRRDTSAQPIALTAAVAAVKSRVCS